MSVNDTDANFKGGSDAMGEQQTQHGLCAEPQRVAGDVALRAVLLLLRRLQLGLEPAASQSVLPHAQAGRHGHARPARLPHRRMVTYPSLLLSVQLLLVA